MLIKFLQEHMHGMNSNTLIADEIKEWFYKIWKESNESLISLHPLTDPQHSK